MDTQPGDYEHFVDLKSLPIYLQKAFAAVLTPSSLSIPILSLPEIRSLPTSTPPSNHDRKAQYAQLLLLRHHLTERMCQLSDMLTELGIPYAVSPELVLQRAEVYETLGYADLAVADAYVAFSVAAGEEEDLRAVDADGRRWEEVEEQGAAGEESGSSDEDEQDADEECVLEDCREGVSSDSGNEGSAFDRRDHHRRNETVYDNRALTKRDALRLMIRSLRNLGCAGELPRWQDLLHEVDQEIQTKHHIMAEKEEPKGWTVYDAVGTESTKGMEANGEENDEEDRHQAAPLFGYSRREGYPWNDYEPNRMSEESLGTLNSRVSISSNGCLEVRKTILPQLKLSALDILNDRTSEYPSSDHGENAQLGLFATRDLNPSETILREHSVLTAIRPHDEPLCDACAAELPTSTATSLLGSDFIASQPEIYACPGCGIPFCSQTCRSTALTTYHIPNLEDATTDSDYPPSTSPFCSGESAHADIHELGRAESSVEPEWDLYFLLIARCIMMAETRAQNPLSMEEVRWLWGEFLPIPDFTGGQMSKESSKIKRTLPYSIHHSLLLPFEFLTTLLLSVPNCAPYSSHWLRNYDWWILQTLFAKFRGVADAKQSTWDGKPESAGVFGLWSLANHSCGGNVEWESRRGGNGRGGERVFEVREEVWRPPGGKDDRSGGEQQEWQGIQKGQEIWNHYTDIRENDFRVRRGRLKAVLGGECECERCIWEEECFRRKQEKEKESVGDL